MSSIENHQRRYMGLIGNNVINEVGGYDGKYNSVVSLASHIIDVGLSGINTYLYDTMNKAEFSQEQLDVLSVALTLHDVDKVVSHKLDRDVESADRSVLETYFEHDWFEVESFLSQHSDEPISEYFDSLLYLIKRTEKRDSLESIPDVPPRFRRLARYCELADSTASVMSNKSSVRDGYENLRTYHDDAQMLQLTRSERPLTHFMIIDAIEDELRSRDNVVLGSTPIGVLYLGDEASDLLQTVTERVREMIGTRFDFGCKAKFRSLNYNALPIVEIPLEDKRDIVATTYIENVISRDVSGTQPVENVPDEFVEILPEALHRLYVDKNFDFEDEGLVRMYEEIKEEYHGMKHKMWVIQRVLENYDELGEPFIQECKEWSDDFEDAITPDGSPVGDVVAKVLGIDTGSESLPDAGHSCYLCGQYATTDYKGGRVFGTNTAYSRRTKAEQKVKRICSTCNMEDAMIDSLIDDSDVYGDDIAMVYLYYDNFTGSVGYEEVADEVTSDVLEAELAFTQDSDGLGAVSLYNPLVHMQPVALDSNVDADKNKKLRMVRNILHRIKDTGMKARITTPFRPFNPSEEVFKDSNPVQPQLGIDCATVERYSKLNEKIDLLDVGNQFHGAISESYPYQYIVPPTAETLIHNAERKFEIPPSSKTSLESYVVEYCSMEDMNTIAELGFELVGYQNSKHSITKMFRESLDALLDARQKGFDTEGQVEVVAGAAMRAAESQSDYVESEIVEEFAEQLVEYCEKYEGLHELSNKQNSIADTYKFAFQRVMDKHNPDE